jgi:hypothetical protein
MITRRYTAITHSLKLFFFQFCRNLFFGGKLLLNCDDRKEYLSKDCHLQLLINI